jgi:hypothetical protein
MEKTRVAEQKQNKRPPGLDAMIISQRDRIFGAVACAVISGVFAGAVWLEGNMPVTWIFIFLGIACTAVFLFAPDSVIKALGSLWWM